MGECRLDGICVLWNSPQYAIPAWVALSRSKSFTDRFEREALARDPEPSAHLRPVRYRPDYLVMNSKASPPAILTFGPTGEPSALSSDSQVIGRSRRFTARSAQSRWARKPA